MVRRRGRRAALLLFLAFVVMPILEIFVLIQVGQAIGPWWTILLLVLDSIIGAWLIKREGRRAWQALQARLQTGQMPARELADGVLVVLGGVFMLSPGFVTDILGIVLILPITRPVFRGLLTSYAVNRVVTRTSPGSPPQGDVVRGEVIDPE
ncbi:MULTISPECIES: FxsA family protein [unclassified Nocardioides]|uniref:FxsA family protein n=1 Tax=unclassified Nocardioides TaxID=2615069 RepID=UPI000701CDB1|nr:MULTISPECIES: FxsA family protein [unclassified Nocardioides]KRA28243.1 exlusion protein FxsA [Nocardioides sp. Root614]KRA86218.1 exlusion protein FxsA [Nocardioides sp. Root682]